VGADPVGAALGGGKRTSGGDEVEISVGPPVVSTHFDDEVVVSELSGEMSNTKEQGYFAADTRLVSGYRLKLGGERPILLNGTAVMALAARAAEYLATANRAYL
jgi:hypothetical protein